MKPIQRTSFEIFIASAGLETDDKGKCNLLLLCMGPEGLDVYIKLEVKATEVDKFLVLIQKFDDYFIPKVNVTYEKHRFFMRIQKTILVIM